MFYEDSKEEYNICLATSLTRIIYLHELTFAITFSKTHAKMIGMFESKDIYNIKSDNLILTL